MMFEIRIYRRKSTIKKSSPRDYNQHRHIASRPVFRALQFQEMTTVIVTEDGGDPTGWDITLTNMGQKLDVEHSHRCTSRRRKNALVTLTTAVSMQGPYEGDDPFATFGEDLATMHQN